MLDEKRIYHPLDALSPAFFRVLKTFSRFVPAGVKLARCSVINHACYDASRTRLIKELFVVVWFIK